MRTERTTHMAYHGSLKAYHGIYRMVANSGPYTPPECQRYNLVSVNDPSITLTGARSQSVTVLRGSILGVSK